jgi:hypothetical protein
VYVYADESGNPTAIPDDVRAALTR